MKKLLPSVADVRLLEEQGSETPASNEAPAVVPFSIAGGRRVVGDPEPEFKVALENIGNAMAAAVDASLRFSPAVSTPADHPALFANLLKQHERLDFWLNALEQLVEHHPRRLEMLGFVSATKESVHACRMIMECARRSADSASYSVTLPI